MRSVSGDDHRRQRRVVALDLRGQRVELGAAVRQQVLQRRRAEHEQAVGAQRIAARGWRRCGHGHRCDRGGGRDRLQVVLARRTLPMGAGDAVFAVDRIELHVEMAGHESVVLAGVEVEGVIPFAHVEDAFAEMGVAQFHAHLVLGEARADAPDGVGRDEITGLEVGGVQRREAKLAGGCRRGCRGQSGAGQHARADGRAHEAGMKRSGHGVDLEKLKRKGSSVRFVHAQFHTPETPTRAPMPPALADTPPVMPQRPLSEVRRSDTPIALWLC